jgi:hypothetical protein
MLCLVSLIFAGMAGMGAVVTGALILTLLAIASRIPKAFFPRRR